MRAFVVAAILGAFFSVAAATGASANLLITVDKSTQRMSVSVNGVQKYNWPVSTGVRGYITPSGKYRPLRLEEDHFSKEWDDAPMPHSIFFTPRGHAIHGSFATHRLGRAASHGCVRLAPQNAKLLFGLVQQTGLYSTTIVIADGGVPRRTVVAPSKAGPLKKKPAPRYTNPYLTP